MPTLNIAADAVIAHTVRLNKIHRSALPVAVRSALNKAAFDVKTNTMPKQAKKTFVERAPTFFRATSKVKPAEGFYMPSMEATVGFMKGSDKKESGGATEDLEQQENAGMIDHRAFIPLAAARASKQYNRRVSNRYRLAEIRGKIKDAKKNKKGGKRAFILTAIYAGKGGFVLGTDKKNGERRLLVINSIKRVGKDTKVNSTAIYKVKAKRKVSVKKTNFMRKASLQSADSIERFYIDEAKKQIARLK